MEMKQYQTPEILVIEMKYNQALLDGSATGEGDHAGGSGSYTPGDPFED